ncbi:MAG: hypothetical protein AAGG75_00985 [Bacteroidota bacterium]
MIKYFTFFLLLLPFLLPAQTVTVSEDVSIRNDRFYSIIGKMKDRFILFRDRETKFEIQAFDERMRLSWNKELELDKKKPEILDVVAGKDYFSVIYKFKKKGDVYVKIHRYDPAATLKDSTTILTYGDRFYSPNPNVIYSENRKALLIYNFDRQNQLEATAFNLETLEVIWNKKLSLKDINFFRDHQQIIVDNRGNMYYIIEKDNKKNQKERHHFEVFEFNGGTDGVSTFNIPVKDILTYDVFFSFDNLNRNLVAAGFYSDKSRSKTNGYFFLKVNSDNPNVQELKTHPFDEELIADLSGKNIDINKGIADIDVQEIVMRRDGGILMIAERNRQYERRLASSGRGYIGRDGGQYIVDYYYDDIIVISIHPDGTTHWKTVLHKRQYSQDDSAVFSSFFLLKTKKSLRFLFNDEIKDDSTVSEYVLQGNGKYDRNSLMSTDDQRIRLRFRDALQVASNELIIPSERRNRLKLVHVQY